ncbi:MAG: dUTP diphosphatase [Promethearchaeota archaeon]
MLKLRIKKWKEDSLLPKFPKNGDAGADCFINGFKKILGVKKLEEINSNTYTLQPLERILCPLGFASEIPQGYYAAVVPRSGLALWEGISIVNSPIRKLVDYELKTVKELSISERSLGGFGSTGKK